MEDSDYSVNSSLFNDSINGTNVPEVENYCGPWLQNFGASYANVHGFSSMMICLFGCILNMLNLIVLTRKDMINPTNTILSGLALSDFLNDLEYVPFALFMRVLATETYPPKTYSWALFVLAHSNFSQVCHTISIILTCTLAAWRYIMVAIPSKSKTLCTMERAKMAVGIAYASSVIVCIPVYITFDIKFLNGTEDIKYYVHYSDLAQANNQLLVKANFLMYSVVIKLIPCIVLTVVSYRLISSLMEAKKRKAQLKGRQGTGDESGGRVEGMLLAILLLFLLTEFPQGILGLLSLILGHSFFRHCYLPIGDLMDQTALLNSAINFLLYCTMSLKFRQVFVRTFGLDKFFPQVNSNSPTPATRTATARAGTGSRAPQQSTVVAIPGATNANGDAQHSAAV